ncbi:MAG: hypothetical protein ACR2LS_04940 [Thermomicrobiales bacterium]
MRPRPHIEDGRTLLWQALWLPFWLGSDVPAPRLPSRDSAPPAHLGLAGIQAARLLTSMARRIWIQWIIEIIARASWLVLLIGCVWLLIELAGGPALAVPPLVGIAAGSLVLGGIFAAITRPTRWRVARMLDRGFGLHERMTTALLNLGREVPAEGERARVVYLQVADAANVAMILRQHPAFGIRLPIREIVLATIFALAFSALTFARGVGGDIPPTDTGLVPAFVPAVERIASEADAAAAQAPAPVGEAPSVAEVQERARRSHEAQRDLQTLGDALADHAVTRQASEEIAASDYDEAAQSLRELGDQADQLSPGARDALASDLEAAADQMSESSADLSSAASEAAGGLRDGGEAAQSGVRQLGEAVESTGEEVIPQQELAGQMDQARAASSSSSEQTNQSGTAPQDGQASSSQESSESGEPQPGEQSGENGGEGEAGESGSEGGEQAAGDQGEGADAQPGEGQPDQREGAAAPGESPGDAEGEGNGSRPADEPGANGAPSDGAEQPGSAADAAGGEPSEEASGQAGNGESGDSEAAQAGSGAGSGDGEEGQGQPQPDGAGSAENPEAEGVPAEQRVNDSDAGTGEEAGDDGEVSDAEAISLSGSAGQGIQTGSDSGSASLGNGAGSASGGGSASQGEVGESGPDSNRVPPEYKPVVESYFSDPAAP